MNKKNIIIIAGSLVLSTVFFFYYTGFKTPPSIVYATDLKEIKAVKIVGSDSIIELKTKEIDFWKTLKFKKVNNEYPGETPDYWINLIGDKANYSVIYNNSSSIVFFQFLPDISYGLFNAPPPGGWQRPLYCTEVNDSILSLIKYK